MESPYKHFIYGLLIPFIYTLISFGFLFIDSVMIYLPAVLLAVFYFPIKRLLTNGAKSYYAAGFFAGAFITSLFVWAFCCNDLDSAIGFILLYLPAYAVCLIEQIIGFLVDRYRKY